MHLLLLSNSTAPGQSYLEHARDALSQFLTGAERLVFVPFALADWDGYTAQVAEYFATLGIAVRGAHTLATDELASYDAIFTGGGNTFRLVKALQEREWVEPIRGAVEGGMPYIGSSAGTNIAAPSLRTTNDMPIVEPGSFETLGLVPFQINPHYLDPDPASRHMGETREERIVQFLEENDVAVLGIREGTWLLRDGQRLELHGGAGGRLFRRGAAAAEVPGEADLSELLQGRGHYDSAAARAS